ncbi:MAG TPA: hypothetical protein VE090_00470 [Methylomirabilota bacterium]|nr:hypothetical protein [Methylomirabilota bacterium]
MPERETTITINPGPEIQRSPLITRGGRTARRVTTLLTAAALAAACSSVLPDQNSSPTPRPPGVEQTHKPLPLVEDELNKLKNNPAINKNINVMSFSSLRSQYKDEDYTGVNNKDGIPNEISDYSSAPVLEITYDKDTQSFRFHDETPKGLPEQDFYNLLLPVENNIVLATAFKTGRLDRVAIRLNKIEPDPTLKGVDDYNGQYVIKDVSDSKKGIQQTVYLFLPGDNTLNTIDYKTLLIHEPLHALTSRESLSLSSPDVQPSTEDLTHWQEVCKDIRTIALDEAKTQTQDILEIMRENRHLFAESQVQTAFDEVYKALQHGDFNKLEPKTGDQKDDFTSKVPECGVIGPWSAFMRILTMKGIDITDSILVSDAKVALVDKMQQAWQDIMVKNIIFAALSEGTYTNAGSPGEGAGHPETDWDELIVSTTDILLNYPDTFAQTLQKLSDQERKVALQLVDVSVKTVDFQVPADEDAFHRELRKNYQRFKATMGQN